MESRDPGTGMVIESYAGNNREPRLPYSLVKDTNFPPNPSNAGDYVAPKGEGAFTLLPPNEIKTLIFCSGQVYYLLHRARELNNLKHIAIVRIEQLNPFPFWECQTVVEYFVKKSHSIAELGRMLSLD